MVELLSANIDLLSVCPHDYSQTDVPIFFKLQSFEKESVYY